MFSSLKRFTVIAGATCAAASVGPVALAGAATPVPPSPFGAMALLQFPALPFLQGQDCSVNQGLLPGFVNLGPTGPLGPLGPKGPLGNTNKNLPCGGAAFDLGPSGPLGPGGALGGPSGQQ
jgi:hypothetical protein